MGIREHGKESSLTVFLAVLSPGECGASHACCYGRHGLIWPPPPKTPRPGRRSLRLQVPPWYLRREQAHSPRFSTATVRRITEYLKVRIYTIRRHMELHGPSNVPDLTADRARSPYRGSRRAPSPGPVVEKRSSRGPSVPERWAGVSPRSSGRGGAEPISTPTPCYRRN